MSSTFVILKLLGEIHGRAATLEYKAVEKDERYEHRRRRSSSRFIISLNFPPIPALSESYLASSTSTLAFADTTHCPMLDYAFIDDLEKANVEFPSPLLFPQGELVNSL